MIKLHELNIHVSSVETSCAMAVYRVINDDSRVCCANICGIPNLSLDDPNLSSSHPVVLQNAAGPNPVPLQKMRSMRLLVSKLVLSPSGKQLIDQSANLNT